MSTEEDNEILEKAHMAETRDLAKEYDTSEAEIRKRLKDHGFLSLEDFTDSERTESLDLTYKIGEMEKRKLQGIFGEKIAVFVKGRIRDFLEESLGSKWELRQGVKLKTEKAADAKSMWYGDRSTDSGIKISDSTVRHRDMEKDRIREKVKENHFITSEKMFEKFSDCQIPSIDQVYYAVKFSGRNEPRTYHLLNTESSSFSSQEKEEIELRHVEDFKVIGLEIKTTENRAEDLFSNLQRSIRDRASNSPYLNIYSLKVEYDIETGSIPESVDLRIEKCR